MSHIRSRDLKTKIDKASVGHYYINVLRNGDKFRFTHIKLTGAERMLEKDPNFLYCRPLRHSGNRDDVMAYFLSIGSKESDMKAYLADCYSATNFIKMINEYNREVAKMPSNEHKEKLARTTLSLDEIIASGKQLIIFKEENARVSTPVARSPTPAANGGRQNLKSRVVSLPEDKVLDITSFNPEKKTGIKTVKKPNRGHKQSVGNSAILKKVYFDFTKPIENGIEALVFLKYNREKAEKIMQDALAARKIDLDTVALK